ncbi:sigma-70 family RNA polymerase sigma factor [Streptomyces sp. NPDC001935]
MRSGSDRTGRIFGQTLSLGRLRTARHARWTTYAGPHARRRVGEDSADPFSCMCDVRHSAAPGGGMCGGWAMSVRAVSQREFALAWSEARLVVGAYCRRATRNREDAEDLFQRVALRAWRGYPSFRGDAQFLTWVMAIARREAARLAVEAAEERARRAGWDDAAATLLVAEPDTSAADTSWLGAAVLEARQAGVLGELEFEVVRHRLLRPEDGWERLAERLGVGAVNCAVAHTRAVPKLRVFLLLGRPERFGGVAALSAACAAAAVQEADPLSPAEEAAFRALVLRERPGYRARGWRSALRGACAKVVEHLGMPE